MKLKYRKVVVFFFNIILIAVCFDFILPVKHYNGLDKRVGFEQKWQQKDSRNTAQPMRERKSYTKSTLRRDVDFLFTIIDLYLQGKGCF